MSMAELVRTFRGRMDLADPTCEIYILEGLRSLRRDVTSNEYGNADAGKDFVIRGVGGEAVGEENMLLARVVARGPKTSVYAPKTRICVTRTPLCPIASFALCNVARLRQGATVLDPFARSRPTSPPDRRHRRTRDSAEDVVDRWQSKSRTMVTSIATTSFGTSRRVRCPRRWRSSTAIACRPTFVRARVMRSGGGRSTSSSPTPRTAYASP